MASTYSAEYQRIIKALRAARIAQGVNQATLAQALGKPQSFIAKIENGERRLDIVEFIHISRLLSLDPIVLLHPLLNR
ncbi:helix-turn-helix domain-containing protein [Dickeya chrysanthemi]|uniref:helix-turn-helix domain-containing protein n=1 Tax=Dickeya chrysanthemi TaxID=556 RepID=UPI001CF3A490|nr:helix-turn-helix transcriptional regulator [Dickeya chrysanthemi]MCA7008603.1 helix-turn-helix domain-containing protein [Dickeya chrysanthemi]